MQGRGSVAESGADDVVADVPKVTNVCSSSAAVRLKVAEGGPDIDNEPMRHVDEKTGALEIYASSDALMKWVPKFDWGLVAFWCRIPIFRVRLFRSREAFLQGGLERSYIDQVFPRGEDLLAAILWWRKRVREEGRGFAVFEGGFDTSGLVYLTDPPLCCIDAESGEVQADGEAEIDRKRELHMKRRGIDARWVKKGVPEDVRAKIVSAEVSVLERKRRGEEYALRGGWLRAPTCAAAIGAKGAVALDVARHNDYQKRTGCQ
mmetsp:Transcript_28154/g.80944  ORF Transcript_28154/g.80944 Transcript_28154/m.80944 type:complete len:262 (-) Transcript_28154:70-855(-)